MGVFIIAEAGVNHNGSIKLAKQLIDVAVESGADAVKFQTFKTENLVSKTAKKADYQKKTTDALESQFDMIKKLELDVNTHKELLVYCQEKGIMFLSTPFDHDSINLLSDLGLQIFKIPSGEITNLPYLRHIGSLRKKVVLSTGMSTLQEVENALTVLIGAGTEKENITTLHANTMYPTPMEDVNLNAMLTIQKELDIAVGYSDHTIGIEVDIAAVAMGASIIEKHVTFDKKLDGPDHKASLNPKNFKLYVKKIRQLKYVKKITQLKEVLGSSNKKLTPEEIKNKKVIRKSLVAKQDIKLGEIFSSKNLTAKRPGHGKSPMQFLKLIGTRAKKDIKKNQMI